MSELSCFFAGSEFTAEALRKALRPDSYTFFWDSERRRMVLTRGRNKDHILSTTCDRPSAVAFVAKLGFVQEEGRSDRWSILLPAFVLSHDGSTRADAVKSDLQMSGLPYTVVLGQSKLALRVLGTRGAGDDVCISGYASVTQMRTEITRLKEEFKNEIAFFNR